VNGDRFCECAYRLFAKMTHSFKHLLCL